LGSLLIFAHAPQGGQVEYKQRKPHALNSITLQEQGLKTVAFLQKLFSMAYPSYKNNSFLIFY
jgi:hypothetical protein